MKRVIIMLIIVVIIIVLGVFNTNAYYSDVTNLTEYHNCVKMGDVTGDYIVDVLDVTEIQRILARVVDKNAEIEYIGDVDGDGCLSVFDATNIQMWLAEYTENEIIDTFVSRRIEFHDFYQNYDSDMAMAGVPVTFTVNASAEAKIISYGLYVNDELVAQSVNSNSIEYTFPEPGNYRVKMEVNTPLNSRSIDYVGDYLAYRVKEYYENKTPIIKALYIKGKYLNEIIYNRYGMVVYAEVIGGTEPYEYRFVFTRPKTLVDDLGEVIVEQDYSDRNYFELDYIDYRDVVVNDDPGAIKNLYCTLTVYVKDANGIEVSKTTKKIVYSDYPIG